MSKLKIAFKIIEYAVFILCAVSKYCDDESKDDKREE